MAKRLCSIFSLLALIILLQGCSVEKGVSQQEALDIAQDFVNTHVKFFVDENEAEEKIQGVVVPKAAIAVTDISKKGGEWEVELVVQTEKDGEIKKAGMVVVVDADTGEVKKDRLRQFRVTEIIQP